MNQKINGGTYTAEMIMDCWGKLILTVTNSTSGNRHTHRPSGNKVLRGRNLVNYAEYLRLYNKNYYRLSHVFPKSNPPRMTA